MSMAEKMFETKNRCIWMDAGLIRFKLCDKDFDCLSCPFDQAMTESANQLLARRKSAGKPEARKIKKLSWQEKMHQRFGERRECPLMKSDFCHQCSFDELLEEQFDFFLAPENPRVHEIFGIKVTTSNFLHRGHTWVALENTERVRIGIDDFSQKVLGPATEIAIPKIGQHIEINQPFLSLNRHQKQAIFLAPISGIIEAINPLVGEKLEVIHNEPYGDGWLFLVSPSNLKRDLGEMLFAQCNIAWTESEMIKLLGMLEQTPGIILPSGGTFIDDVYGKYPQLGWERLVHEFLHSA